MSLGSNIIKFRKQKGFIATKLLKETITSGYRNGIENNKKIPVVD